MCNVELVSCHTCGDDVAVVRSVRIKLVPGHRLINVILAPGVVSKEVIDLASFDWTGPDDPAYLQFRKNAATRRSFICEKCYRALNTLDGVAEISRDGKLHLWSMSVPSRDGKAAVYNKRKWLAYQKRIANKLGIDLS